MKLNNKGLAISGILYSILVLFIVLVFGILSLLASTKFSFDRFRKDIMDSLNKDVNYVDYNGGDYVETINGLERPQLTEKMIPVTYNQTTKKIIVADPNIEWYNYNEKKWANAVILKNNIIKGPGNEIKESEISQVLVWIPRFEYKANGAKRADLNFVKKTTIVPTAGFILHPSFTFGEQELEGFWISKFEISGTQTNINSTFGATSLVEKNLSTFFTSIYNSQEILGVENRHNFDMHIPKSTDWGAVGFLTYSKYGLCLDDVSCNLSTENTTLVSPTLSQAFTNFTQSTTQNIYGLYDTFGNKMEYVMTLALESTGNTAVSKTGFNGINVEGNVNIEVIDGIKLPDRKYYDLYPYLQDSSVQSLSSFLLGDGLAEVSGSLIYSSRNSSASSPVLLRGGYTRVAGTPFTKTIMDSFEMNGSALNEISTRIIVTKG
ncbi:MAG: hypothetical protein RR623_06635 [Bacilli bacterium]